MTDAILDANEIRVLGSLIEKQITTPEYYPLTLNALTNACNQKNNRDPIVSFDEATVVRGLDSLRGKKLVSTVTGSGIRVPKYKHNFVEVFELNEQEVVVLCLLMLRGPQTIGEIRSRCGSMYNFESTTDVETTLTGLNNREQSPLVRKLPRQTGQKESRYIHLLSGEPKVTESDIAPPLEAATIQVLAENERIVKLEEEVKTLHAKIQQIEQRFAEFKKQFE
jgi:uncharacterized protein YceH (UPF0502 family)